MLPPRCIRTAAAALSHNPQNQYGGRTHDAPNSKTMCSSCTDRRRTTGSETSSRENYVLRYRSSMSLRLSVRRRSSSKSIDLNRSRIRRTSPFFGALRRSTEPEVGGSSPPGSAMYRPACSIRTRGESLTAGVHVSTPSRFALRARDVRRRRLRGAAVGAGAS